MATDRAGWLALEQLLVDELMTPMTINGHVVLAAPCPDMHPHAHFFCARCHWEIDGAAPGRPPLNFAELAAGIERHICGGKGAAN